MSIRSETEVRVQGAYEALNRLLDGKLVGRFYNRPEVLAAERRGLSVVDGVLAHVLRAEHDDGAKARCEVLLRRVEQAIEPDEVVNRCHNLHAAVAEMLNEIGCPAVVVWGSINARTSGGEKFILAGYGPRKHPDHRPGHSWIVTPYHAVVDLALAYQANVGDDYEALRGRIPSLIMLVKRVSTEPDPALFTLPNGAGHATRRQYANETRYHNLLGWSIFRRDDLKIRYLPGSLALAEEQGLNEIAVTIGGRDAGTYFKEELADLASRVP